MQKIAILALTRAGLATAEKIAAGFARSEREICGLAGRAEGAEVQFTDFAAEVQRRFATGHEIIGICAAGHLIRAVAPMLGDRHTEPPVVAVSADGAVVVPLLGGLQRGNERAHQIADLLGGKPAVTASGFRRFGFALETAPPGYSLANLEDAAAVTNRLLEGEKATVSGYAPWLTKSGLPIDHKGCGTVPIKLCPLLGPPPKGGLLYVPKSVAAAILKPEKLTVALLETAFGAAGVARSSLAVIVVPGGIKITSLMRDVAAHFHVPLKIAMSTDLSERALQSLGAQAGVVQSDVLDAGKIEEVQFLISDRPIDVARFGLGTGQLSIVGIGPGKKEWMTPDVMHALGQADALVGYGRYLDQVPKLHAAQKRYPSGNREELDRARQALDLAAQGQAVALVSSGDPGIFAMAAAVMEVLEDNLEGWANVKIEVHPGISAMQAAAAQAGAPLGHDFCVISLSDILKSQAAVEKRLLHAAQGDFVLVLYNPASKTRRTQIETARTLLMSYRRADTPVLLARSMGRKGEKLELTTLKDFDPATVDMRTLVIIGSSQTKKFTLSDGTSRVYTPRRYGV